MGIFRNCGDVTPDTDRAGCVRGVLLWNTWDKMDAARALIAEPGPFDAQKLKGRIA